jgi:hypothetical protein
MRLFTNSEYAYEHRDGGEDADAETEGSRGIGFRISDSRISDSGLRIRKRHRYAKAERLQMVEIGLAN